MAWLSAASRRAQQNTPKSDINILEENKQNVTLDVCGTNSSLIKSCLSKSMADKIKAIGPMEETQEIDDGKNRSKAFSERSDSGISDCSSVASTQTSTSLACTANAPLFNKKYSISEEEEIKLSKNETDSDESVTDPTSTIPKEVIDTKVDVIRKKFANLSKNIDEMDKKLENVGRKLEDIVPVKIADSKKPEIQRVPSLKDHKKPELKKSNLMQPTESSHAKITLTPKQHIESSHVKIAINSKHNLKEDSVGESKKSNLRQHTERSHAKVTVAPKQMHYQKETPTVTVPAMSQLRRSNVLQHTESSQAKIAVASRKSSETVTTAKQTPNPSRLIARATIPCSPDLGTPKNFKNYTATTARSNNPNSFSSSASKSKSPDRVKPGNVDVRDGAGPRLKVPPSPKFQRLQQMYISKVTGPGNNSNDESELKTGKALSESPRILGKIRSNNFQETVAFWKR